MLPRTPGRTHGGVVSTTVVKAHLAVVGRIRATEGQRGLRWRDLCAIRLPPATESLSFRPDPGNTGPGSRPGRRAIARAGLQKQRCCRLPAATLRSRDSLELRDRRTAGRGGRIDGRHYTCLQRISRTRVTTGHPPIRGRALPSCCAREHARPPWLPDTIRFAASNVSPGLRERIGNSASGRNPKVSCESSAIG